MKDKKIEPWIDNPTKSLQMRRIKNAEDRCKKATSDWGKNFWYNTFKALCEKYDKMDYFRKAIH